MLRIISLVLLFAGLIVITTLAYLNSDPVHVDYLFNSADLPLAVLLLISFITGVLISSVSYLGVIYFQKRQLKRYRKQK
jgi:uncharacterized integral membrane protein